MRRGAGQIDKGGVNPYGSPQTEPPDDYCFSRRIAHVWGEARLALYFAGFLSLLELIFRGLGFHE